MSDYEGIAEIFNRAAALKDGWGWAVNNGEIWIVEACVRLILAVEKKDLESLSRVKELLDK